MREARHEGSDLSVAFPCAPLICVPRCVPRSFLVLPGPANKSLIYFYKTKLAAAADLLTG